MKQKTHNRGTLSYRAHQHKARKNNSVEIDGAVKRRIKGDRHNINRENLSN